MPISDSRLDNNSEEDARNIHPFFVISTVLQKSTATSHHKSRQAVGIFLDLLCEYDDVRKKDDIRLFLRATAITDVFRPVAVVVGNVQTFSDNGKAGTICAVGIRDASVWQGYELTG